MSSSTCVFGMLPCLATGGASEMCSGLLRVPGMNLRVGLFRWTDRLVNRSLLCLVTGVCMCTTHRHGFVFGFSWVANGWRIEMYDRLCCAPMSATRVGSSPLRWAFVCYVGRSIVKDRKLRVKSCIKSVCMSGQEGVGRNFRPFM